MSLDFLAQNSDQIRDFFVFLIILFGLAALVLFVKGYRRTQTYRLGLGAIESWERDNPDFNIEEETDQSPEDVIKEAKHPLAVRWLERFIALYRQNKAPDVEGLIGSIEHELTRHDEAFRSLTSSLILLGLLGTFVGLIIVVIPIPGIIQGAQTSPTLSQEVKIEDVFSTILEGLGQSVKGMPLAFITSIIGLFATLILNGLYSLLLLRTRNTLLANIEECFNAKIAPRFAIIPPQLRLSRVFTRTVNDLYDKYFTTLSDYLDKKLKEIVDVYDNYFLVFSGHLDKRLKEIVDSNARLATLVEESGTKLKESSEASLKSAEIFEQHKETVAAGANEIMRAAKEFSQHIKNFERLSDPLNALKDSVDTMLEENKRLMARQFQSFDERMDKQSKLFEARMETLGDGLAETLETIRGLNDTDYRPNFVNIQNLLTAVRESQDAFLEFQKKTLNEQGEAFEKAKQPLQDELERLRQDLQRLGKEQGEAFEQAKKPLQDESERLRQELQGLNKEIVLLQNQLGQVLGAINQGFKKTDEDLQVLKAIDQVIPQLEDMHATAQAIEKQLDGMAKSPQGIAGRSRRKWNWNSIRRLFKKKSKE